MTRPVVPLAIDAAAPAESALPSVQPTVTSATSPVEIAPPEAMLSVPAGTFTMGADAGGQPDERPAHAVTLRAFYLDRTEVTQVAYAACVTLGACREADPKVLGRAGGLFVGAQKPIVGVSWDDASAYCTYLKKRLPREAEFERAVRGEDARKFPWGNQAPSAELTVFSTRTTSEVGTHPRGRGPYGHDDLAGNVWEWMSDFYDPLAYTRIGAAHGEPGTCSEILTTLNQLRRDGKRGFTGSNPIPTECERAIRGGAYNYEAEGLRSTNRVHHPGKFKLLMTGFRCAKDAE